MATGIANAIIYVRGVDMLTRPIQSALAKTQQKVQAFQKQSEIQNAKAVAANAKITQIQNRAADLASSYLQQSNIYSVKRNNLLNREAQLTAEIARLSAIPLRRRTAAEKQALLAYNDELGRIPGLLNVVNAHENKTTDTYNNRINRLNELRVATQNTANSARNLAEVNAEQARKLQKVASFQQVGGKFQNYGSQLGSIGLMSSALVSLPIVAGVKSMVDAYAELDAAMRNVQSIGRQTDAELNSLTQRFITMSKNIAQTTSTPKELAEAYYEIQSAAYYGNDATRILEATTKAATAGLADQKATAQAVAMTLHAYGASTAEVTRYTDVMMRAVDIGIFHFEDLTTQMGDFINTAGMLGVPIEEVMAALTAMTKKGIPISEAATSLNRVMMNYLKPAKQEIALAQEYGIELSANTIKTKGFAGAMSELIQKTNGSEDVLANLIGEVRGIRGVFALGSDGLQMYYNDLEALKNSAGTVDRVFGTQMKSLQAKFKSLKNTLMAGGLSIAETLVNSESFNNALNYLKLLATGFANLSVQQRESLLTTAATLAAFGPGLLAASGILNVLGKVIASFGTIVGAFAGVQVGALALVGSFLTVGAAIAGLILIIKGLIDANNALQAAQREGLRLQQIQLSQNVADAYIRERDAVNDLIVAYEEYNDLLNPERKASYAEQQAATKKLKTSQIEARIYVEEYQKAIRDNVVPQMRNILQVFTSNGISGEVQTGFANFVPKDILADPIKSLAGLRKYQEYLTGIGKVNPDIDNLINNLQKVVDIGQLLGEGNVDENWIVKLGAYMRQGADGVAGGGAVIAKELTQLREALHLLGIEVKDAPGGPFEKIAPEDADWAHRQTVQIQALIDAYDELQKAKAEANKVKFSEFALANGPSVISNIDEQLKQVRGSPLVDTQKIQDLDKVKQGLIADFNVAENAINAAIRIQHFGDAVLILKNNLVGSDASIADFVTAINTLPETLRNTALALLQTSEGINALRNKAVDPIVFRVQLLTEGFDKIESSINGLVGYKSIPELMTLQGQRQDTLTKMVTQWENMGLSQREIDLNTLQLYDTWDKLDSKSKEIADNTKGIGANLKEASQAASFFAAMLGQGSDFSKGLGNLLPGGENGPLAPGANGAFEALYRLQDIAMSKTRGMGVDTQKWMDMYGLNPDQAKAIVEKFQQGIFDADVLKYIDKDALINTAKIQMIADASKKALAEQLAKESGLDQSIFDGMFGIKKDKNGNVQWPTIDMASFRTTIKDEAAKLPIDTSIVGKVFSTDADTLRTIAKDGLTLFAGQFTIAQNEVDMKAKGAALWDAIGSGAVERASNDGRFAEAVYRMVVAAIKQDYGGK